MDKCRVIFSNRNLLLKIATHLIAMEIGQFVLVNRIFYSSLTNLPLDLSYKLLNLTSFTKNFTKRRTKVSSFRSLSFITDLTNIGNLFPLVPTIEELNLSLHLGESLLNEIKFKCPKLKSVTLNFERNSLNKLFLSFDECPHLSSFQIIRCRDCSGINISRCLMLRKITINTYRNLSSFFDQIKSFSLLEELNVEGGLTDLSLLNLQYLRNLNTVTLSSNSALFSLEGLIGCTQIRELVLNNNSIENYCFLTECSNLERLQIVSHGHIRSFLDVSSLALLPRLQTFVIQGILLIGEINFEYYPALEFLTLSELNFTKPEVLKLPSPKNKYFGLKKLNISDCDLSEVRLENISNLEEITLFDCCELKEVNFLPDCPKLKRVLMGDNQEEKNFLLRGPPSVEFLSLRTRIKNLSFLQNYSHLKILRLFSTQLRFLVGIDFCPFLEELSLFCNEQMININQVGKLRNLKRLEIRNCFKMKKLPDLSTNINLEHLILSNLDIFTLFALDKNIERYSGIKRLEIDNCSKLVDFVPIERCFNLEEFIFLDYAKREINLFPLLNCTKLQSIKVIGKQTTSLQTLKDKHPSLTSFQTNEKFRYIRLGERWIQDPFKLQKEY